MKLMVSRRREFHPVGSGYRDALHTALLLRPSHRTSWFGPRRLKMPVSAPLRDTAKNALNGSGLYHSSKTHAWNNVLFYVQPTWPRRG